MFLKYKKILPILYKISMKIFFLNFSIFIKKKYNINSLDLSGGCAMNSLANGKIKEKTNFKNIYIQPAAYDAGCPLGSVALQLNKFSKRKFILSNYLEILMTIMTVKKL